MRCCEFVLAHPSTIESECFGHMCEDFNAINIIGRIDKTIAILKMTKMKLTQNLINEWNQTAQQQVSLQQIMALQILVQQTMTPSKPSKWQNFTFFLIFMLTLLFVFMLAQF